MKSGGTIDSDESDTIERQTQRIVHRNGVSMCLWTWDVHVGSIPTFSIPVKCHHWKCELFILYLPFYEWFPVLHVGWLVTVQVRVLEFLLKERLWKKKIIVVHVNGTRHTKAFAVMVTVNIAQILDVLMIAVNVGRE